MHSVLLILSVIIASECSLFTRVVEVGQGRLRGLRGVGQDRYYGIPYATSQRFQPPEEPPKWNGIFNAINRFTSCAQTVTFLTLGTEDCLQLDLYAPESARPGDKLPVMMFIHGGAYYYGSKAHYDPEFLVTKRSVAIIINYRVGVLGFLCLNDIANLGLKDQVAALKWIKENVAAFGGDPDNVTIFGQSAGASSAAMHLLSPYSEGLFHKLILFSGTPLAPWAFNPEPWTGAFEDARKIRDAVTTDDVVRIFKEAPLNELLKATHDISLDSKFFKYSPCVESNSTTPFFPDTPFGVLKSGNFSKIPMVVGFTNVEGMLFYGIHNEVTLKDLNDNFNKKLPSVFSWCSARDRRRISKAFRSHYFKMGRISGEAVEGVTGYYSDWIAYSSADAFSEMMAKSTSVFNYMFSYEGERNFAKMLFGSRTGLRGASHSDDIFYVFKPAGLPLLLDIRDKLFVDRLTTMLTNFMRTGNPTPSRTTLLPLLWPLRGNSSQLLRLDQKLAVIDTPATHRGAFWLRLLCDYGLKGYVPCESRELCNKDKG